MASKFVVPPKPTSSHPVWGNELIKTLYSAVALRGPPGSGKTVLLFNMLIKLALPLTKILIFCPSTDSDDNWRAILTYLDKMHIAYEVHSKMEDAKGVNVLQTFMEQYDVQRTKDLAAQAGTNTMIERQKATPIGGAFYAAQKEEKKKTFFRTLSHYTFNVEGKTYEYAPFVVVFDDMGMKTRHVPVLEEFVRRHRHYRSTVIFSSQDTIDSSPSIRGMIQDWFLYGNLSKNRVKELYNTVQPAGLTDHEFAELYARTTTKRRDGERPYLHIDTVNRTMDRGSERPAEELLWKDGQLVA